MCAGVFACQVGGGRAEDDVRGQTSAFVSVGLAQQDGGGMAGADPEWVAWN